MQLDEVSLNQSSYKNSNISNFTFGFEAEMILKNIDSNIENLSIPIIYLDSIETFSLFFVLTKNEIKKLHRMYDLYTIEKEEEMDYETVYVSVNEFISEVGLHNIIKDINPTNIKRYKIKNKEITIQYKDGIYPDETFIETPDYKKIYSNFKEDFEKITKNKVIIHGIYHENKNKSYKTYYFEPDNSINANDKKSEIGLEICSPIFDNYNKFISNISLVFDFIKKYGYTNDTTGFHINIGIKGNSNINIVKAYLLSGSHYISTLFGRESNKFAKDIIKNIEHNDIANELYLNNLSISKLEKYINDELLDHSSIINSHKNYYEFRVVGNSNYENKLNLIKQTIDRYIYVLNISTTTEYNNDYKKKLYQIISSLQPKFDNNKNYQIINLSRKYPEYTKSINRLLSNNNQNELIGLIIKLIYNDDFSNEWDIAIKKLDMFKKIKNTSNEKIMDIMKYLKIDDLSEYQINSIKHIFSNYKGN